MVRFRLTATRLSPVRHARSSAVLLRPHPDFIPPCLPTASKVIPLGPDWIFEIKHDGFRFIVRKTARGLGVFSRSGLDCAARVPAITEAMRDLPIKTATIDGECVICRDNG